MRILNRREEWFVKYRRVVKWIAVRVAKSVGWCVDDLIGEAESALALLLVTELEKFDASRGSVVTWVTSKVRWHLLDYVEEQRKREWVPLWDEEEAVDRSLVSGPSWLERMWSELGNEGRMLLRVVFEAPGVLGEQLWVTRKRGGVERSCVRLPSGPSGSCNSLQIAVLRHLKQQEWSRELIITAWRQVEEACSCG